MKSHGRASNYTFTERRHLQPADRRQLGVHREQCEIPAAAARSAWRGARSATQHKTVIRAGFGMYNDLQDALGYRTDQNAPFNPTYSLPNVAVSALPLLTSRSGPVDREAGARRSAAESADADADLLVVPGPAGDDAPTPR